MNNSIKKVLGFVIAIALIVGMIPSIATEVYADEAKWIYVDGQNGDDNNDGSEGSPVQSWSKAKELLGCAEGGIYVVGTVAASGEVSTKNPAVQSVKRAEGFNGVMFEVSGEATFANIDVDGEHARVDCEVIRPNSGAKINFLSGAVFHNIGYVEDASENEKESPYNPDHTDVGPGTGIPDNFIGGVVCSLVDPVTILVDGATFCDNNGKGIFFTPINGGMGGKANVTFTMKSGTVKNNKGYFYHNEGQYASNNVYIYNALIRNNDASNIASRYSFYTERTGVVYVCDAGRVAIKSMNGAAIFDNKDYDLITQYDFMKDDNQGSNLNLGNKDEMLGGGNPNWSAIQPIGQDPIDTHMGKYYAYTSNPSSEAKEAAVLAAKSVIEENQSPVIASNGTVQFGVGNETVPETPEVTPVLQGCDEPPAEEPEEPKEEEPPVEEPEEPKEEEPPVEEPEEPKEEEEPPVEVPEEPKEEEEPPVEIPEEPKVGEPPIEEPEEPKEELPPPMTPSTGNPETPTENTETPPTNNPQTNNPPANETPAKPVNTTPATGDESGMMLWMGLALLSATTLLTFGFATKRK